MKKLKPSLNIYISVPLIFNFLLANDNNLSKMGEDLYFSKGCSSCHGIDGKGLHNYPSLSGRSSWDLKRRLLKYKKGIENNQQSLIMIPFAKSLSDQEIEAISIALENLKKIELNNKYRSPRDTWNDGGGS